jgi:hypothetical protein
VEVFLFFGENILYLVVIAANILHGEGEQFSSSGILGAHFHEAEHIVHINQ